MISYEDGVRMNVWLEAWKAVAASDTCVGKKTATSWADECLSGFDKQFRRPEEAGLTY